MLQQTQVKTVIPYFYKFIKKFKDLKKFSQCSEKRIMKLWEGLGYYRRAKNLLATSKILVKKYNLKLPKTYEELKRLPGVGDYTANSLLGLVHNQPTIAIDGNVRRIFSRLLNIREKQIDFDKLIKTNKTRLFNTSRNSDFVEALMEFGALICKPKDPKCKICNLNNTCKYFKSSKKIKLNNIRMIKNKNYNIFCYINRNKQIALTKQNKVGFLKNSNLPKILEADKIYEGKNWKFLKNYKNSISNLNLNINLYYKFSKKIPVDYKWYWLDNNKEFIPSFTKKIFKQVSNLF